MSKESYNDVLRAKLEEFIMEQRADMGDESLLEDLYRLVKNECLRSFKNGLAAGKSRADGPRRHAANIKGTALANGRLRPVPKKEERELVVEEDE